MDALRLRADELRSELSLFRLKAEGSGGTPSSAPSVALHATLQLDCAYQHKHFLQAIQRRPYIQLTSNSKAASVRLEEYEVLDWDEVMGKPYVSVPSFCVRKGLSRKANMAKSLGKHCTKCRGNDGTSKCPLQSALPETVVIDSVKVFHDRPAWLDFKSALVECLCDAEDAMAAAPPGTWWILKPSLTNKGAGIRIVSELEAVEAAVKEDRDVGQWVLQRYLHNPLLLNPRADAPTTAATTSSSSNISSSGHKFHLRVYVVAVGALTVYVYREALLLFAVQPYTGAGLEEEASHITNTCVGVTHQHLFDDAAHVRCLSELPALFVGSGVVPDAAAAVAATDKLWQQICAITAHAFASHEGDVTGGYMPIPHCFEAYGVDFLVDDALNVMLLEFNPSPDIKQTGSRLEHVITGMVDGLLAVTLDARAQPGCDAGLNVEPPSPPGDGGAGAGVWPNGAVKEVPPFQSWAARAAWEAASGAGGATARLVTAPHSVSPPAAGEDSGAGWAMVYSKKWGPAHAQMNVSFS